MMVALKADIASGNGSTLWEAPGTMNTQLQKDPSIIGLLEGLWTRLGQHAFDVVDHWEGDLCAVGIARPDNHAVLVYISTFNKVGEGCSVSLESPPQSGVDFPYTAAGDYDVTSFDQLAQIVQQHFESGCAR